MQVVSIIRNRGQLTIPDAIRQVVNWVTPSSAVTISVRKANEIVITPHQQYVNWEKVWDGIKKSRSIKGSGGVSGAEFLELDRNSH